MMFAMIAATSALASAQAPAPDPDSPEGRAEFLLQPEFTRQWEKEAATMCVSASSPAECRPVYVAARYSEAAMEVCRYTAGLEFRHAHGTTTTTYAQHSIRRTCRESIEFCRQAWRNYDRINFAGRPGRDDPRRTAHFALVLTERCGAEAGVEAPF